MSYTIIKRLEDSSTTNGEYSTDMGLLQDLVGQRITTLPEILVLSTPHEPSRLTFSADYVETTPDLSNGLPYWFSSDIPWFINGVPLQEPGGVTFISIYGPSSETLSSHTLTFSEFDLSYNAIGDSTMIGTNGQNIFNHNTFSTRWVQDCSMMVGIPQKNVSTDQTQKYIMPIAVINGSANGKQNCIPIQSKRVTSGSIARDVDLSAVVYAVFGKAVLSEVQAYDASLNPIHDSPTNFIVIRDRWMQCKIENQSTDTPAGLFAVAYGAGKFVAVGAPAPPAQLLNLKQSADGYIWNDIPTAQSSPLEAPVGSELLDIIYISTMNKFITIGFTSSKKGLCMTSVSGELWTKVDDLDISNIGWVSIAHNDSTIVVLGTLSTYSHSIKYSDNSGATWHDVSYENVDSAPRNIWVKVLYCSDSDIFFAFGNDAISQNMSIWTSNDGITWSQGLSFDNFSVTNVAYNDESHIVIVGTDYQYNVPVILYSLDLLNNTPNYANNLGVDLGSASQFDSLIFADKFYAFINNRTIESADGQTWRLATNISPELISRNNHGVNSAYDGTGVHVFANNQNILSLSTK